MTIAKTLTANGTPIIRDDDPDFLARLRNNDNWIGTHRSGTPELLFYRKAKWIATRFHSAMLKYGVC
jgi:hypothetical protein